MKQKLYSPISIEYMDDENPQVWPVEAELEKVINKAVSSFEFSNDLLPSLVQIKFTTIQQKLQHAYIGVEAIGNKLYGTLDLVGTEYLTPNELEALASNVSYEYDHNWGFVFGSQTIAYDEHITFQVHFDQGKDTGFWFLLTREELLESLGLTEEMLQAQNKKEGNHLEQQKNFDPIYTKSRVYATENGELEQWRISMETSQSCANAIHTQIDANNYELNRYDMPKAVQAVIDEFGYDRVQWVLANIVKDKEYDGRFSLDNKIWATDVHFTHVKNSGIRIDTHPTLLDSFIKNFRKNYQQVMLQTVGQYEQKHHMAERNRLTWYISDIDEYRPNTGLSEQKLEKRYREILEKQKNRQANRDAKRENKGAKAKPSVIDQIKASQSEPSSAPASKEPKNKAQGPEL